jgi:predicted GNAT superfamily acetyltransferase
MRWAFDPARTHNAHFNLDILGATGRWFERDFYGVEDIGRDPGMRTDRLIVEWDLLRTAGAPAPPPAYTGWGETRREDDDVLLGAPRDWDALVARDREASFRLRDDLATELRRLIDDGYVAISCQTCSGDTAVYRFRRESGARPPGPQEG